MRRHAVRIILAGHHSGSRNGSGRRCAGHPLRRSEFGCTNGRSEYLRSTVHRGDLDTRCPAYCQAVVVAMLYTIAVILLVLWLLGVVGTYTIGAFVHVLLVIALVLFVLGLLSGRRTVI
jgi:hypothetical protein